MKKEKKEIKKHVLNASESSLRIEHTFEEIKYLDLKSNQICSFKMVFGYSPVEFSIDLDYLIGYLNSFVKKPIAPEDLLTTITDKLFDEFELVELQIKGHFDFKGCKTVINSALFLEDNEDDDFPEFNFADNFEDEDDDESYWGYDDDEEEYEEEDDNEETKKKKSDLKFMDLKKESGKKDKKKK